MKKIVPIALISFVLVSFSGCSTVSIDNPTTGGKVIGMWTTRTLQDIRFYRSSVEDVSKAAEQALRDAGCFVTHYTSNSSGNEITARGIYDVKITVDVVRRRESAKKGSENKAAEFTDVSVVYGAWGDLPLSQNIVSQMLKYLPNEN